MTENRADVDTIRDWLRAEDERSPVGVALPPAGLLLARARIVERLTARERIARRADRSLSTAQGATAAVLVGSVALWRIVQGLSEVSSDPLLFLPADAGIASVVALLAGLGVVGSALAVWLLAES